MRICSLVSGATEILFALGVGDQVVGVTGECDYPAVAKARPAVVHPRIDPGVSSAGIDRQVRERAARGESSYAVDAEMLRALEPDLIVTQDTCHVCAASPPDLTAALGRLRRRPRVVSLAPKRLADLWSDIRTLGQATGRRAAAETLSKRLKARLDRVEAAMRDAPHPRVLCLEWLDPLFVAGHWVPEMVELAGGQAVLGRAGKPSPQIEWPGVFQSAPEAVVLMPCGYNLDRTLAEYIHMALPKQWWELEAVRDGRVSAVNGKNFFSRSGPRLIDGIEILGHILHPDRATWLIPPGSVAPAERAAAV
jgi:iron complex transport system substrate-binding protein